MLYMGVDPGKNGAIAVIDAAGQKVDIHRLRHATMAETWAWVERFRPTDDAQAITVAALEKVHAMPGQGVTGMFRFGVSLGALQMALTAAGIPTEDVTPGKWQQQMRCRTGGDKNVTKQAAARLWPTLKMSHAVADALLIAEWNRRYGPWATREMVAARALAKTGGEDE